MIYKSPLELVGNTPILELKHCVPHDTPHTFLAKLEFFNPGGSVKDRIALALVEGAEKKGDLKKGGTIVEATSGNTGVGLAMIANLKGYGCVFVMPEKTSSEKRNTLTAYGAKIVITPNGLEPEDPNSYYSVAKKIAKETEGGFLTNQYHNLDNRKVHKTITGPEIWKQLEGQLDVMVAGAGTGGTISGVGEYLKQKDPHIKIILNDPVGSILYDNFHYGETRAPAQTYQVEGIGEDLIPENLNFKVIDDCISLNDKAALLKCREVAQKEGLLVGLSSGHALASSIEYSKKLERPSRILVIMPDGGRQYLGKVFNDQWMKENNFL